MTARDMTLAEAVEHLQRWFPISDVDDDTARAVRVLVGNAHTVAAMSIASLTQPEAGNRRDLLYDLSHEGVVWDETIADVAGRDYGWRGATPDETVRILAVVVRYLALHPLPERPTVAAVTDDDAPDPVTEDLGPCQCIRTPEFISPMHTGHCCFLPADSGCHPAAIAAWWEARPSAR